MYIYILGIYCLNWHRVGRIFASGCVLLNEVIFYVFWRRSRVF